MGALTPHLFEGQPVRIVDREGEPAFVTADVARILGYEHTPHLSRLLEEDEKGVHRVDTPGGEQGVSVVTEPGLYRAVVQRRATEALPVEVRERVSRFQRWVFHDVLPAIRRTGTYTVAAPGIAAPTVASTFKSYFGIGRLIGLDRNQSALSANRATLASTGVDPLALMGHTHLVAPQQAPALTPTDLGRDLGKSAIAVNNLLVERGYQIGKRDLKDRGYWMPTEHGEPFAVWLDTGKRHSDGTPVRQLKWSADVLPLLRAPSHDLAADLSA